MSERPAIALVLGSGAARGLAHIGVIRWLEDHGFTIASISGASMGALVGAVHAAGKLETYARWVCALDEIDVFRMLDFSFSAKGLISGEKLVALLKGLLEDRRIEDLPIRYTAVAVDIEDETEVWLDSGPLFDAVRASISIPTLFPPHCYRGRTLFDGGLLNPLPIAPAFGGGADLRVAVNLNGTPDARWDGYRPPAAADDGDDSYRKKIKDFIARLGIGRREPFEDWNLIDIALASLDTMQGSIARMKLAAYPPDITLTVPRNRCGAHQFYRAREMIDYGVELADESLRHLL